LKKKKTTFYQKKQIFLGEKAFFFKSEMGISTFQDTVHNMNGATDTAYSKIGPNYEL